jgi:hypothetical protein
VKRNIRSAPPARKSLFLGAAVVVLRRAREPLDVKEIVKRAVDAGLLHDSQGRTPERSMSAALYMDVRNNPASPIRRLARAGPVRAVKNSVKWTLRRDA